MSRMKDEYYRQHAAALEAGEDPGKPDDSDWDAPNAAQVRESFAKLTRETADAFRDVDGEWDDNPASGPQEPAK